MRVRTIAVLVLLAGLGGIIYLAATRHAPPPSAELAGQRFTSSEQCAACHREVYDEWKTSFHGQSWTDPLVRTPDQSDNFAKKDCIPCHAPRPVFEHGIGKNARVVERSVNRHEGVDCLACHKMQDKMAATRDGQAACNPVKTADLSATALCAPCHNQHLTVDEWEATDYAKRGESCNQCHMGTAERAASNGRPAYTGKSHVFAGGHSLELLQKAGVITTEVRHDQGGRTLLVTVQNANAGHNFPTDSRDRALDLVVTLIDRQHGPVAGTDPRDAGQEPGTRRLRFRNPYRTESGKVDTQIRAGQSATLEVPIEGDIESARVELIYKLTPFTADADGTLVFKKEVEVGS